jgi:hypothetical protein
VIVILFAFRHGLRSGGFLDLCRSLRCLF